MKPSKVKKRRGGKKQLFSQEDENVDPMVVEGDIQESQSPTMAGKEEVHTAVQGHVTGNGLGLDDGGPLEITGVHLGMGEGEEFPIKSRRPSRAEERKLETERKRLEKREMERLRKQEKEEEQRLKVRVHWWRKGEDGGQSNGAGCRQKIRAWVGGQITVGVIFKVPISCPCWM